MKKIKKAKDRFKKYPVCYKKVSKTALTCPHCGAPIEKVDCTEDNIEQGKATPSTNKNKQKIKSFLVSCVLWFLFIAGLLFGIFGLMPYEDGRKLDSLDIILGTFCLSVSLTCLILIALKFIKKEKMHQ